MARITLLPSDGEDFELLGTMLMRWGHTICSIDDGAEHVIVFGDRFRGSTDSMDALPRKLVGSRNAILIEAEPDEDKVPSGWTSLRKDAALYELERLLGREV